MYFSIVHVCDMYSRMYVCMYVSMCGQVYVILQKKKKKEFVPSTLFIIESRSQSLGCSLKFHSNVRWPEAYVQVTKCFHLP